MTKPQATHDWHDASPRCKALVLRLLREDSQRHQEDVRRGTKHLRALLTIVMSQASKQREQRRVARARNDALAQLKTLQGALAVLRGTQRMALGGR
jgi:hypothetical protein